MQYDPQGGQGQLHDYGPKGDLEGEQAEGDKGRPVWRVPDRSVRLPEIPRIAGQGKHQHTHGHDQLTVGELDDRVELEGREKASVAERPILPAPHPGAGDPDDGAEDDEQVGAGGGAPGERREASRHGFENVYSAPHVRTRTSALSRPLGRAPPAPPRPLERRRGRDRFDYRQRDLPHPRLDRAPRGRRAALLA